MDTSDIISVVQSILTLLAILVALFGKELINRYRRPKLRLEYDEKKPFLKFAEIEDKEEKWRFWIRVKAVNKGKSVARKCRIFLEQVEVSDYDKFRKIDDFDPIILNWVGFPSKDSTGKSYQEWLYNDIESNSSYLADIGYLCMKNLFKLYDPIGINRANPIVFDYGIYRLRVAIYAENCKTYILSLVINCNDLDQLLIKDHSYVIIDKINL